MQQGYRNLLGCLSNTSLPKNETKHQPNVPGPNQSSEFNHPVSLLCAKVSVLLTCFIPFIIRKNKRTSKFDYQEMYLTPFKISWKKKRNDYIINISNRTQLLTALYSNNHATLFCNCSSTYNEIRFHNHCYLLSF